ncbi:MAG: IS110 family RNA-guided transposase [Planctomycetota bacterium]|jgi:transposase
MKYVGIDWATEVHAVAVVDEEGHVERRFDVEHNTRGLARLRGHLERAGGSDAVRIAIESGAVLLVDQLLEDGYAVCVLNPKQADRFRDRLATAGAKDDRRDAEVLAHAVRTDGARLPRLEPEGPLVTELRERCRGRSRLRDHHARLTQQLRALLQAAHPGMLEAVGDLASEFALDLIEAYPSLEEARRARRPRLDRLIRRYRIRRFDAAGLQGILRAPGWSVRPGVSVAQRDELRTLVPLVRAVREQLRRAEERIAALASQHADYERLQEIPGVGVHLSAALLAEIGDDPARRGDPQTLAGYAGVAPVTRSSGTRRKQNGRSTKGRVHVTMRRACNRRLQASLWIMARCSQAKSRWAKAYVDWRREQGHSYNSTLRSLAKKWAKILAHLLRTGERYDDEVHIAHLRRADVPWIRVLETQNEA